MPASRMSRRVAVSGVVVAVVAVVAGVVLLLVPVRASIAPVIGGETRVAEIACGNAFTAPPLTRVGPAPFRRAVDAICWRAKAPRQIGGGALTGVGVLGLAVATMVTIGQRNRRSGVEPPPHG